MRTLGRSAKDSRTPARRRAGVLQVITDTDRRGAQVFAVDLEGALSRRGWQVETIALSAGTTASLLDVPSMRTSWRTPRGVVQLRRRISGADVVVAHGSSTLPACALAASGTGVPFVYRSIGDPAYWGSTPGRRARVRASLFRSAAVAALWPGAKDVFASWYGISRERIRVIPNGVDPARFPIRDGVARQRARHRFGLPSDVPIVAYVGALSSEKRVELAIEAVAQLGNCHLVIAGDGELRDDLEDLASRRLGGRVRFVGSVSRPQSVFAAADVAVLTSRTEGLPGVLIEAGLTGIPAVATDVGGVAEIVRPGVTGELVTPDASSVAAGLDMVLRRPDWYATASQEHCRSRFALDVVADAWADLLVTVPTDNCRVLSAGEVIRPHRRRSRR